MKRFYIYLLVFVTLILSCKQEEKKTDTYIMADFEMSTNNITHNTPITITYNGNDKNVEGFYYQFNGYRSYPQDLNFINGKATISIPDSISAIALNFKIDGKYLDNDKQGYLFAIKDNEGNTIAGSQSALENYKLGNGQNYGLKGDAKVLIETLETDIAINPEIRKVWGTKYLNTVLRNDRKKGQVIANDMLSELYAKKEMTEKDYGIIHTIYSMTRKTEKADSISKIAITKYPKGKLKQQSLMNSFYDAKTLVEKEKIVSELETNFDIDPSLSYAITSIAAQKFKEGDEDGFKTYANKIKSPNSKAGLYNSVAWPLAEEGKKLEMASKISKSSLDLIMQAKEDVSTKPDYYSERQYQKSLENSYNMYADTYALIQYKLGNLKEAIKYQTKAIGEGDNAEMNERYIEFLVTDKQYKLASDKANIFLNNGKGGSKMTELYKTAYMAINPEANDFDTIIAEIKQKAHDKELAKLKSSMLDEEAPQFVLKNLDNENISLLDLKGKTVILDFWATWCGPCKASFPGMQEVVEKYKDDENVVLLFVDTFEDGENREKNVAKFINDNKYDFHVLIDDKIKDSDKYQVANKYGITGIPTKIIIGPSGKINFKAVGYSGNNDKLKMEMDLMIDLLKS